MQRIYMETDLYGNGYGADIGHILFFGCNITHKYKKNGRKTIRIGSISITFAFRNQQIMRSHAQ